jgi:glycosyltransferase involved in cell wall biosynthesis
MWLGKSVSVVFPVYNEAESVVAAINDFFATGVVDEIVVVNNNSTDRSAELVATTSARLILETRQGYGFALRRGLAEATGDMIVLAEPDGTFLGKDIMKLLVYADDFDIVLGTRTTPQLVWNGANMSVFMRYGNWLVAKLTVLLFNTGSLSDCGCTMRLLHRRVAEAIAPRLTVGASHLLPEIVILGRLSGFSMVEVPVHYKERLGRSKITGSTATTVKVALRMIGLILWYRIATVFKSGASASRS